MTLIKSISGIRGIVGKGLDEKVIQEFAFAFSKIQKGSAPILIARDGRDHGEYFASKISRLLLSIGREVIYCDIIPTPTAQLSVEKYNCSGGIVITASHNPKEWNGLKFIDCDGTFLSPTKNQKLLDNLSEIPETEMPIKFYYKEYHDNAIQNHINNILNLSVINLDRIRNKKFKVVVDAINSSASKILPILLEKFNCHITTINCNSTGEFVREAEPLPQNLSEISEAVIKTNSDLGIATDPDGDRLAIIDEKGNPIGEESTLVICCDSLLKEKKNITPIVTNLSTSMAIENLAHRYNVDVIRTKVGEINVVIEMKKRKSIIGGEGNGGVILPESHYGRDSLVATALLLNRLSMEDISISQLYNKIPHYTIIKDSIKTETNLNQSFKNKIIKKLHPLKVDETDGIKLIWDNQWIHIRKSNTEPIIRFYSESEEIENSNKLIKQAKEIFNN